MAYSYNPYNPGGVGGGGPIRADLTSLPPIPDYYPPPQNGGTSSSSSVEDFRKLLQQQTGQPLPVDVGDDLRKKLLAQQGSLAGRFADQAQQGYAAYGQQAQSALDALRRQASGQDSVSQIQLRQALGQQLAQQRSMAAGAAPRNAAGAARTAAIQMGRASTAMAGQQAAAGQQERNQANSQYGQLINQLRGQDLSAATQSRQTAMTGYGAPQTGAPSKTWIEEYGPAIAAGAAYFSDRALKTDVRPGDDMANRMMDALHARARRAGAGMDDMPMMGMGKGGGMGMSDRALKTGIASGDDKANAAMAGLKPYTYAYKDQALGAGPQVGVMAQDLQKAGLGQAVIKTPIGLAIDPGKLSGANTAMIAALGRRVAELEGAAPGSPAARKASMMARGETTDPQAVRGQEALDSRRAKLQELDLRAAGAYPGGYRPLDTAGNAAQDELDRRRAMMAALARAAQVAQGGR